MPERVFGHLPGHLVGSRFDSRAELSQPLRQFLWRVVDTRSFALPDNQYTPTQLFQIGSITLIPTNVCIQLRIPELSVGLGAPGLPATLVLMPEAAMNEDDGLVLR